ncbi:redoxin domain-containing protein [Oculatella sp. LEGE 06141]|uniref:peroxiredoxin family protein n=1 Tax=Oculatella sp. LEGE 06141 TaxID=1828648 RepID=UPI001881E3D7|nr:redoxin domain-containing protein [Oculatella sp. LEGE 06141]MBE9179404.1 redoxin domain-containing protein [Oculatella sp. LEGE 06141]
MLTSTDFRGLLNRRFFNNFMPIPATSPLRVGTLAPPFELLNVATGQRVRLSDYTGNRKPGMETANRPVVLAFTRIFTEKQYCPFCYPHIKEMRDRYSEFADRGVEVLMITSTDDRQSKTVLKDLKLPMPLLSDPGCRVFRTYQVGQALGAPLPAQFILDRQGKIRFRHLFSFLESNANVDRLLEALDQINA